MKKPISLLFFYSLLILLSSNCGSTLSPDNFVFDSKFDSLYKAISNTDTIFFENSNQGVDTFVLTHSDSLISDRVNCFMCRRPGKSVYRSYKQIPINYWSEPVLENEKKNETDTVAEAHLVTITVYPIESTTSIRISFKNFRCVIEKTLGNPISDSLLIGNRSFTDYYILNSTSKSRIIKDSHVESILVTLKDGIIAYKEKSGILRKRVFL
jgi:hypothetical protein